MATPKKNNFKAIPILPHAEIMYKCSRNTK